MCRSFRPERYSALVNGELVSVAGGGLERSRLEYQSDFVRIDATGIEYVDRPP